MRNSTSELSYERPDPLLVASRYKEPYSALICALFSYGKASLIVKFLETLEFSLLDKDESDIRDTLSSHYYRFQNSQDIIELFITINRLKKCEDIEHVFMQGYLKKRSILDGLNCTINRLRALNPYTSRGYNFLIGKEIVKLKGGSTMKRWLMYLRWMVRCDSIDFGLWRDVESSDLLMPLDTHTFSVSHKLGLLKRKSCDMQASIELTNALKEFDKNDPLRYDFALYRVGQEGII